MNVIMPNAIIVPYPAKMHEVKKDILTAIKRRYNVIHAVDDNPLVIKLWQENSIPTTIVEGYGF